MNRVGQIHIFIGIYGVYTVFWAGKSPYIRSYTVCIYGSDQPHSFVVTQEKEQRRLESVKERERKNEEKKKEREDKKRWAFSLNRPFNQVLQLHCVCRACVLLLGAHVLVCILLRVYDCVCLAAWRARVCVHLAARTRLRVFSCWARTCLSASCCSYTIACD